MKTEIRPENEMKDSGIEWVKHIPRDWDIVPLKRYFQFGKGLPITKADLKETGEKVISYGQIHAKFNTGVSVDERLIRFVSSDYKLTNASSLCSKGDIILADTSEDKEGCGNAVYIDCDEKIFAGYHTITLKSDRNNKYLAYLFQSGSWREQIQKRVNGVKLFSITKKILNQCTIILPSLSEQQAIVDYLDEVCSKIDEIIVEAKASIEEYKELKQAVIFEAVTKGLSNSSAIVHNSDIDWADDVCSSWNISQIRYLYELRKDISDKPMEEVNLISLYTDKGVLQHSDIEKTTGNKAVTTEGYKVVYPNDIVVNIILCWMGAMGRSNYYGVTSPAYDIYKPIDEKIVSSRYYHYLFRTDRFAKKCYTVGRGIMMMRWRTYSSEFRSIKVPVPPKIEQDEIADFLDKRTAEIDSLITEKQALIADLEAYKKSLIYELVTGKRRVV